MSDRKRRYKMVSPVCGTFCLLCFRLQLGGGGGTGGISDPAGLYRDR